MRNTLLRVLAALMCVLAACAEIPVVQDFDLQKIAGKWYMVGIATNAHWFVSRKAEMKMGTTVMAPTEGGDLDLSYASLNADGSCWRMTNLAKKTDTPGRFTFRNQIWNNDNDMRFVDVVYDDYAIVHTVKTQNGVSQDLVKFYSQSTEASAVQQQKFTALALSVGVLAENIVILPTNGECAPV